MPVIVRGGLTFCRLLRSGGIILELNNARLNQHVPLDPHLLAVQISSLEARVHLELDLALPGGARKTPSGSQQLPGILRAGDRQDGSARKQGNTTASPRSIHESVGGRDVLLVRRRSL